MVLVLTTKRRQVNSQELLDGSSIRINNKLPLLCKKSDLLNLLGKPDKILDPKKNLTSALHILKKTLVILFGAKASLNQ